MMKKRMMKKRMMKNGMMLLLVYMAMLLTACGINQVDKKQDEEQQADVEYDKTDLDCLDEVVTEEKDNTDVGTITDKKEGTEEAIEQKDSASTEKDSTDSESYPGPEVVELVNLRGDEATAYKLADGTYMDRIERRFTYNGTDTWTDEDGVEWNEKVNLTEM